MNTQKKLSTPPIVPELDVLDFEKSRAFYTDILGFEILYERPEELFAYLKREEAHIMLESASGPGRRFGSRDLERPLGRGMNLQILTTSATSLYERVTAFGLTPEVPLEEKWYRKDSEEVGNRQFVIADCDGYLLRFFEDLGARPLN